MPKRAIDYSKTCIYKIEHCDDPSLVYVGSTTDMVKRKTQHKTCCNNPKSPKYNLKVYQMIRQNGGWDAFKFLLVEKYPCNDSHECRKREDEVIKLLKCNMNSYNAYSSEEQKKITAKKYVENNKAKINDNAKEYYANNREKCNAQMKEYYQTNKQKVLDRIQCECGAFCAKVNLHRHRRTTKHNNNMDKIEMIRHQNAIDAENDDSSSDCESD
jgi:hypothetical protein